MVFDKGSIERLVLMFLNDTVDDALRELLKIFLCAWLEGEEIF